MDPSLTRKQLYYDAAQAGTYIADPNRFVGTLQRPLRGLRAATLQFATIPHSWYNISEALSTNTMDVVYGGDTYTITLVEGNYDVVGFGTAFKTALNAILVNPDSLIPFQVYYSASNNYFQIYRPVDTPLSFPSYDNPLDAPRLYNILGIDFHDGWAADIIPSTSVSGYTGFVDMHPVKSIQITHNRLEHSVEYASGIDAAFTFSIPVDVNFGEFILYNSATGHRNVALFPADNQNIGNVDLGYFDQRGRPIDFRGALPVCLIEYICDGGGSQITGKGFRGQTGKTINIY